MSKKRLSNYGLWLAIAALVLMVLHAFGVNVVDESYNEIVNAVLGVLVLLGVISNPTKPGGSGFNL